MRAVGDLDISSVAQKGSEDLTDDSALDAESNGDHQPQTTDATQMESAESPPPDPLTYEPNVSLDGVWLLSETDVGKSPLKTRDNLLQ